jgi:glycosyltransferase involved in cell wall biosynthesis
MDELKKKPLFAVLPIPYSDDGGFWFRDAGLIVLTLRSLGYDAYLVALEESGSSHDPSKPLVLAQQHELEDPQWWQKHAPCAVISMMWAAPRFEKIRVAIKQSTPRILEKLDTDGIRSPRILFWRYVSQTYFAALDARKTGVRHLVAPALALGKALAVLAIPRLLDQRMVAGMCRLPVLVAETPIAVDRCKQLIRCLGFQSPRFECVPHPVDEKDLKLDPSIERKNQIIAVGRWTDYQKNFPLLIKTLKRFLQLRPSWSATIIGKLPNHSPLIQSLPRDVADRIQFLGYVPHDQLSLHYQSSKIFFMSSRYESFNISAAEALCCGCSVVGSNDIASVPYFTGKASGTPVCRQTPGDFVEGLCAEVEAWSAGHRKPDQIASEWRKVVGAEIVSQRLVDLLGEIPSK